METSAKIAVKHKKLMKCITKRTLEFSHEWFNNSRANWSARAITSGVISGCMNSQTRWTAVGLAQTFATSTPCEAKRKQKVEKIYFQCWANRQKPKSQIFTAVKVFSDSATTNSRSRTPVNTSIWFETIPGLETNTVINQALNTIVKTTSDEPNLPMLL